MDVHEDITDCVERLREALAANGITLPSLGVDLPSLMSAIGTPPLVSLGNCNAKTARALIAVLGKAAVA